MKRGDEFRLTFRKGRSFRGTYLQLASLTTNSGEPARVGFVLSKKVGNAVIRNKIRRRLRAITFNNRNLLTSGQLVAFRGFPQASTASFADLERDASELISKAHLHSMLKGSSSAPVQSVGKDTSKSSVVEPASVANEGWAQGQNPEESQNTPRLQEGDSD